MIRAIPPVAVLAVVLVSACASPNYPSLARRPQERETAAPADMVPASAPTANINPQIDKLLGEARAAHRTFIARQAAAQRAANGAGSPGSDTWASASIALAGLQSPHEITVAALSQLDAIESDHRIAMAGGDDTASDAIMAARSELSGLADAETSVLNAVQARLGG